MKAGVGALVTLEVPADSPVVSLPWIITIGPLSDDDEWEAVVCGPYEREHALALAEEVVADEDLMAVVEPVLPHVSVDAIRAEIASARALALEEEDEEDDDADSDVLLTEDYEDEAVDEDEADEDDDEDEDEGYEDEGDEEDERPAPPTPQELRAGFARIAQRLTQPPASWPSA
jgi:hypothetical protein